MANLKTILVVLSVMATLAWMPTLLIGHAASEMEASILSGSCEIMGEYSIQISRNLVNSLAGNEEDKSKKKSKKTSILLPVSLYAKCEGDMGEFDRTLGLGGNLVIDGTIMV
uniref:Uncharacterized protein n=1 Tax=Cannabis sativa TaxID=3483 RepID=A0A803PJR4_CANSA